MENKVEKKKNIDGVLYIVISSFCFGVIPILAKLAYEHGSNTYSVLSLRFLIAAVIVFFYIIKNKVSMRLSFHQAILIIILGVFGYSGTVLCLFYSYKYISAGIATMLSYTYPTIVTILSSIIYKEKVHLRKIVSLFMAILGMVIIIFASKISFNIKGILLAMGGAFCYSIYVVGVSSSKIRDVNNYLITFYISVISFLTASFLGISTKGLNFHFSYYSLVCVILLAFISTVLALTLFLKGVKIIGPSNASILNTLEPIVSLILGILILKESITVGIVVGSIFVVASAVILAKGERT